MNDFRVQSRIFEELNPDKVTKADIVVGLFSQNEADNIVLPLTKAFEGLNQTYPEKKCLIACLDANSSDETKNIFLGTEINIPRIYISTGRGLSPKFYSFFNLLTLAERLEAKTILALDTNIVSIKRTWISRLTEPILNGQADLTAPFYSRQNYDAPLTTLLVYPLFRAHFGRRILQPIYTDKAFSGEMNKFFLQYPFWPEQNSFRGIELTMQILAISKGARICQSFMADPRVPKDILPLDASTGESFISVLRSFFEVIKIHKDIWWPITRSRPTSVTGTDLKPKHLPPRGMTRLSVFQALIQKQSGEFAPFWQETFEGSQNIILERFLRSDPEKLTISVQEWATLLYQSAALYPSLTNDSRETLLRTLVPAFFARLLSYIQLTGDQPQGLLETINEEEAGAFEVLKPQLHSFWQKYN
jgi:hypothetical protein